MPRQPPAQSFDMLFPSEAVAFDPDAFDELIHTQGVEMVHWRAMRCPVGMVDPDDIRRPHEHHENCSNGFIYTPAGTFTCGFLANSKETHFNDYGRMDGSTVQVVLPRFYDEVPEHCDESVYVELAPFDRIYLKEMSITVVNWQTFQAHATGVDRLQFPAVKVYDLVDATGRRYHQDKDFVIVKGQVKWVGVGPGVDPTTRLGVVCSVRYSYRPFWYVKNLVHEVRVAQITDPDTMERRVHRMPQSAMLQREYFFEKEQRDADSVTPNSPRQQPGPADGTFGPR